MEKQPIELDKSTQNKTREGVVIDLKELERLASLRLTTLQIAERLGVPATIFYLKAKCRWKEAKNG